MNATATAVAVGDKVRLTKAIWDDGEDHHPPGWLAMAGEVLIVRHLGNLAPLGTGSIAVSHEDVTDNAFWISRDEYEPHNAELTGSGQVHRPESE